MKRNIEIRQIKTFKELNELECKIYEHACNLDTIFYRTIIQVTYDYQVHLLLSDLAWNYIIAEIKVEDIKKDPNLKDWLKRKYSDPDDWVRFFDD